MNSLIIFFIYALFLSNFFVWMISPQFLYEMMWKLDIFIVLIFAPLLYKEYNNE